MNTVNFSYKYGLVRYNPDGTPDDDFGTNGKLESSFGIDYCIKLGLQSDGKIVVMGRAFNPIWQNAQAGLVRHNTDGVLDSSFAVNGLGITRFPIQNTLPGNMVIQPDDKILVVGTYVNDSNSNLAIARFKTDGHLDSTFSTDAHQFIDIGSISNNSIDISAGIAMQSDGKIILASNTTFSDSTGNYSALVRLDTNGQLDTTFGNSGKVIWKDKMGGNVIVNIRSLPDNKILCCLTGDGNGKIILMQFESNGELDINFGTNGITVWKEVLNNNSILYPGGDLLITGNKIFVSGYATDGNNQINMFLAKFEASGFPDTTFGPKGVFILESSEVSAGLARSTAAYSASMIILFGHGVTSSVLQFITMRILTDLNVGLLDQQSSTENLLVYPNPLYDHATLQYQLKKEQPVSVFLTNSGGQTVASFYENQMQQPGGYSVPLRLPAGLPAGIYFLNIQSDAGITTVKVVKKVGI